MFVVAAKFKSKGTQSSLQSGPKKKRFWCPKVSAWRQFYHIGNIDKLSDLGTVSHYCDPNEFPRL